MRVNPTAPRVLVADDQVDVLEALRLLLKSAGLAATTVGSPAAVLAELEAGEFDALLMDMNYARDTTSGREGLDLLARVHDLDPTLPVVVMTAWGTVEGAVEAMRRGARDYVQKPWDNDRLLTIVRTQVELAGALRATRRLAAESSRLREQTLPELCAASRAMQGVLRLLEKVAPSDANVLVTGEHGTGKEVVARWIHAASSRAGRAFVAVNAGALAEGVFESELFGHVRGAFTDARADRAGCVEMADGGTLFLDEIGTMPAAQQAKLLRVLQTGEFHPVGSSRVRHADVRVVSATNVDVAAEVRRGAFREDLLYRLNTVEVCLPPLRERREDVPVLAGHFLVRSARRYGKALAGFAPAAAHALLEHPWPGNVRELEHVVERAVLLADADGRVDVEHLALRAPAVEAPVLSVEALTLDAAEAYLIRRALERAGGNVVEAARALGLSRSALYRRLVQHGIRVAG
jgi:DNA-binding NtrC family response regulator